MRNRIALVLALSVTLLGARAFAQASLTYHNSSRGANVHIVAPVVGDRDTFAGELNFTLSGGPADIPVNFVGFCADPAKDLTQNATFAVDIVPLPDAGLNNSGRAAWLYKFISPTIVSNDDAAALQLAIWNVLTDDDSDVTTGAFLTTSTGNFVARANGYLAASANQMDTASWFRVKDRENTRTQDVIGPDGSCVVPEPATIALMGLGLLPFAVRRRR